MMDLHREFTAKMRAHKMKIIVDKHLLSFKPKIAIPKFNFHCQVKKMAILIFLISLFCNRFFMSFYYEKMDRRFSDSNWDFNSFYICFYSPKSNHFRGNPYSRNTQFDIARHPR